MLDNIMLYWLPGTATSSARLLNRARYGYVTSRFADDDRQLCLAIEFARQHLIISNTFPGADNAVRCFDKKLRLFSAHWRAGFFVIMFAVIATGTKNR
jgi:hypothetical protein